MNIIIQENSNLREGVHMDIYIIVFKNKHYKIELLPSRSTGLRKYRWDEKKEEANSKTLIRLIMDQ